MEAGGTLPGGKAEVQEGFAAAPPTPMWRHRRRWLLAAAAVVLTVAAIGLWAMAADDDSDSAPVATDPPTTESTTPPATAALDGALVFAADAGAGDALTDPIEYQRAELMPEPKDLYVIQGGEPLRRLVSSGAHERCPAFSSDGERLAYLSVPSDPPNSDPVDDPPLDATLVILRLDGSLDPSDPELLVPFSAPASYAAQPRLGYPCPRWSPDGSRLAYLAHPAVPPEGLLYAADLRVASLDGQEHVVTSLSTLAQEAGDNSRSPFAWSPSGDAIAFLKDDGMWTATLDGRAPSLLWQPEEGSPMAVSWSSTGELAVIVTTELPEAAVYVVDADGGSELVGSSSSVCGTSARWSPDGTRLAFVATDGQIVLHDRGDRSTVLLPPPVVDDHAVGFCDVAWSPSGEQLLALAHAMDWRHWGDDHDFVMSRGMALLSLSTDGALRDVLTPWTWAFDWTNLDDVASHPSD